MSIAEIVESVVAGAAAAPPRRLRRLRARARPTPLGPCTCSTPARRRVPRHRTRRPRAGPGLRRRRPRPSRACTPATPTTLLVDLADVHFQLPPRPAALELARTLGRQAAHARRRRRRRRRLPRWRRVAEGLRHSMTRDAEAISHHYDVSNRFYEMVLGPSMTYTCACYPDAAARPSSRPRRTSTAWCSTSCGLKPGDRLLDIGCGWGGMVRYAARHGVRVLGVTLSRQQARGRRRRSSDEGLADLAEVRHSDYRDVTETGFDAVSSIGLTEHIGVRNYPAYFGLIQRPAAPRRAAAQPLHHPARQQAPGDRARSSTATSSPTVSSPAPAASSPRRRTSASRCGTRRTCASTTP